MLSTTLIKVHKKSSPCGGLFYVMHLFFSNFTASVHFFKSYSF
ncbi:hypothetical protein LFUMFP_250177 [Latilactobacillus fuchuensis]|uniref:Uncharacterized protein n=1 Tax=Latilactobacillus fuchuensis TaxID=164393 RepID=A0A2N9DW01_9LACO|nr:hypothetical protein LFUMFP_250177 [Latilactobacillus fuchuensis]